MTRLGVISDIHGNLTALDAVLQELKAAQVDRIVCCGDMVGPDADSSRVLERCLRAGIFSVRGNYEDAVCHCERYRDPGREEGLRLATAMRDQLTEDQLASLHRLSATLSEQEWVAFHGSLRAPMVEYILDERTATETFRLLDRPIGLFGHSHIQGGFQYHRGKASALPQTSDPIHLAKDVQYLINPGSVGIPRDGDPRPAFGVLDLAERTFAFRRVGLPHGGAHG